MWFRTTDYDRCTAHFARNLIYHIVRLYICSPFLCLCVVCYTSRWRWSCWPCQEVGWDQPALHCSTSHFLLRSSRYCNCSHDLRPCLSVHSRWHLRVQFIFHAVLLLLLVLVSTLRLLCGLRGGLAVGRWTCDLQVAGSIPGRSAFK